MSDHSSHPDSDTITPSPTARSADVPIPANPAASTRSSLRPRGIKSLFHTHLSSNHLTHSYSGAGTISDPFIVEWLPSDPQNPLNFPTSRKWMITLLAPMSVLVVSFSSSAYTGGVQDLMREFNITSTVALIGISVFVLGFAVGPLFWGPLSEIYGRRSIFVISFAALTLFDAGCVAAQSSTQLFVLRAFAGLCGSATLTNTSAVVADIWAADGRGLAMGVSAAAPFLGPILGPIGGGFFGEATGWRWIEGLMTILTAVLLVLCGVFIPETYGPVILERRARALARREGMVFATRMEIESGNKSLVAIFKVSLSRPWLLLVKEPIVLLLSVYLAILYGTLYIYLAAFPIVYREARGWSQGLSGLAFVGMAVGSQVAIACLFWENTRYKRVAEKCPKGLAPPEARLPITMVAAIVLPVGLFWFAWTNGPEIHWIVSILSTFLFGFGNVWLTLGCVNYLIDAYVIYSASVMAASSLLRSVCGAGFPLFTAAMYKSLGLHWGSSVPGFAALICAPFPFLLYKYGAAIRKHCHYAADAQRIHDEMLRSGLEDDAPVELFRVVTNLTEK
jgi:multidrug resistance protein